MKKILRWTILGTFLIAVAVGGFCIWIPCGMASCSPNRSEDCGLSDEKEVRCLCPPVIHLQPFGKFSQREAQLLGKELTKRIEDIFGVELECEVHPPLPLSDTLMNDGHTRYRADKIIHSMAAYANRHNIYIGLTHKDISCSVHGKKDWGVQGLSLIPGNACVASTFRVKDRRDFWKVVCHEFIHTYFTYNHCPKDDPSCLMQAAKGHPRYKGKNGLCPHCSNALKI
jgi:archaemetzincin